MHADYAARAPAGYRPPGGVRGARLALIGRGWYPAYAVAGKLNRIRLAGRPRRERP
jgi:hypothetical protein